MSTVETRGGRLKEGRQASNKAPEEIALEINQSVHTYIKWEANQTQPKTLDQVSAVCKATGITPNYYIDGPSLPNDLLDDEATLVSAYRALPDNLKESFLQIITASSMNCSKSDSSDS
ncbi:helix-turn-helix domain-containing protein [Neptuniibacter sp.]|uniref:helix-turn-helix domain-containing protein n=1 Tax=Neptuniibacter sp. TaxID=1962643 RepID=UPI00261EFF41|nr:helix-turn-helix domain-containing protein [Neptuniibacter sp.]MCP4597827.1 helix-turn-helix transcriptional regulator [Neptuniibacter sp.]